MAIEDFIGQMVNVVVTMENGNTGKKLLKVCKANTRSVLFIEVDRENRKNIFRKVSRKDIMNVVNDDTSGNNVNSVYMKNGVLLSNNKWESSWDSIGSTPTKSQSSPYTKVVRNQWGSWNTTNSRAGFPMV